MSHSHSHACGSRLCDMGHGAAAPAPYYNQFTAAQCRRRSIGLSHQPARRLPRIPVARQDYCGRRGCGPQVATMLWLRLPLSLVSTTVVLLCCVTRTAGSSIPEVRLEAALQEATEAAINDPFVNTDGADLDPDNHMLKWNRGTLGITLADEPATIHVVQSLSSLVHDLARRLQQGGGEGVESFDGLSGPDGTGGKVWMSAVLLSHYLSTTAGRKFVEGRSCVELGSGTGVLSVAAARLGAARMLATDGNPVMEALTALNAHENLDDKQLQSFDTALYRWYVPPDRP